MTNRIETNIYHPYNLIPIPILQEATKILNAKPKNGMRGAFCDPTSESLLINYHGFTMRMRSYSLCSREAPEVQPIPAAHSDNGYWAEAGFGWLRDASHSAGLSAALTRHAVDKLEDASLPLKASIFVPST